MTLEEAKKLLNAVKVEGISEDDAAKLVLDSFEADNRGLVQKRDELLGNEKNLKEKIAQLENESASKDKKAIELETQLKKNDPAEYKKYYEGQAKELENKFNVELQTVTADRDKYRESHYQRVRDDAITTATKDIQFIDGLRDGFVALAMLKNQFKPSEIDGKTIFINQDNKTIEAVLHELSLSKEGKAYIKNGNSGSGASGGGKSEGAPGTTSMTRTMFDAMPNAARMEFIAKGGIVTNA